MRNVVVPALALIFLAVFRSAGISAQQLALEGSLVPMAAAVTCAPVDSCVSPDDVTPDPIAALPSPGTALMSGLALPGMGYFYTDRPALGALVLGAAGATAGLGLLYRKVDFECVGPQIDGSCGPDELSRIESRPLLVPGLAVAGAVTIIGAINAYHDAKRSRFQASLAREAARLNALVPRLDFQSETTALRVEPTVRGWNGGVRAEFNLRF